VLALALLAAPVALAQEETGWAPPDQNSWNVMDYGPFLSHTITAPLPAGNVAVKGIAIRLGAKGGPRGAVLFDTELCRMAAGWTGGFLELKGVAFDGTRGVNPSIKGTQLFGTKRAPGWGSPDARIDDTRPRLKLDGAELPYGPLPRDWARYKGLYVHGDQVVLSYTVGTGAGVSVLEVPGVERVGDATVITRTMKVAGHDRELLLRIAEVMGTDLSVKLAGVPSSMEAVIEGRDGALFLRLPARAEPTLLKLFIGLGVKGEPPATPSADPETLTKGGPPRWVQTVETKGVLGASDDAAYVVDTLPVPNNNPYKSWIRFGGFDFFDGGTSAALCTFSGDVWTCAGIDAQLGKLTWRRFASGLFQPLGLKVVDGKVHTLGRDQITRLHDLNADGEADFYENVNNDLSTTPASDEFAVDLQTDAQGNFYFAKSAGASSPHHGCVLRLDKDGNKIEAVATGLRAPGGIGVGPQGQVTAGDATGSRLAWGNSTLCWIPAEVGDVPGSQTWVAGDKWGPVAGHLLHTSRGTALLFVVLNEDVAGDAQGGVVRFPLAFDSGVMRPRFSPADGQLYLCGMKSGPANATGKDACFQRVRFTGKPTNMPSALKVTEAGVEISFTDPLDKDAAADPVNYAVEEWNDGASTGPAGAAQPKHEGVEVKSAKVSPDGKTVALEIPGVRPVMHMKLKTNVRSADGKQLGWEVYSTINRVGKKKLLVKDRDVSVVEVGS
jgi:hypothetical protein